MKGKNNKKEDVEKTKLLEPAIKQKGYDFIYGKFSYIILGIALLFAGYSIAWFSLDISSFILTGVIAYALLINSFLVFKDIPLQYLRINTLASIFSFIIFLILTISFIYSLNANINSHNPSQLAHGIFFTERNVTYNLNVLPSENCVNKVYMEIPNDNQTILVPQLINSNRTAYGVVLDYEVQFKTGNIVCPELVQGALNEK